MTDLPAPPTFDETEAAGLDGTLRTVYDPERVDNLERAIRIIADALYDEAEDRSWCSEYNQFVDGVNQRLPEGVPKLQPLNRTYRITLNVEIPDSSATSGLERHIDSWLVDRGFSSCHDFEVEDVD